MQCYRPTPEPSCELFKSSVTVEVTSWSQLGLTRAFLNSDLARLVISSQVRPTKSWIHQPTNVSTVSQPFKLEMLKPTEDVNKGWRELSETEKGENFGEIGKKRNRLQRVRDRNNRTIQTENIETRWNRKNRIQVWVSFFNQTNSSLIVGWQRLFSRPQPLMRHFG